MWVFRRQDWVWYRKLYIESFSTQRHGTSKRAGEVGVIGYCPGRTWACGLLAARRLTTRRGVRSPRGDFAGGVGRLESLSGIISRRGDFIGGVGRLFLACGDVRGFRKSGSSSSASSVDPVRASDINGEAVEDGMGEADGMLGEADGDTPTVADCGLRREGSRDGATLDCLDCVDCLERVDCLDIVDCVRVRVVVEYPSG